MQKIQSVIWLILKREYLTRVRKRSFILMSILGPILIVLFYGIIIWINIANLDDKTVWVVDESKMFENKLETTNYLKFRYSNFGLEKSKKVFSEKGYDAILYIPEIDINHPQGLSLFSNNSISLELKQLVEGRINNRLKSLRIAGFGLDKNIVASLDFGVTINTINLEKGTEKSTNTIFATVIGYITTFVSYLLVFLYSSRVMRGVMEEKNNRIVEVIIGSVRPFQLMIGKVLGIGALALTQILIWIVLTIGLLFLTTSILAFIGPDFSALNANTFNQGQPSGIPMTQSQLQATIQQILGTLDYTFIVSILMFYIVFGYLTYSAIFAAIGSLGDNEQDTQQFVLPVTLPFILAISVSTAVIKDPNGQLAFWLSMIPLTSPITMLTRLPFIGMSWELVLSMFILVVSFLGITWAAGRIYKIGILVYGSKPTYKQIVMWLIMNESTVKTEK